MVRKVAQIKTGDLKIIIVSKNILECILGNMSDLN